jgi:glycine/D-amino acid oxidase-like deaminating enzyme
VTKHTPLWLDRYTSRGRTNQPRFRGEADAGVVVIGAGLTGAACALTFTAAGVKTVVLEAGRIGAGATAGSPGLVREDFDTPFVETAATYGLRTTRTLWQGMRRASRDLAAALRRHQVRCDLRAMDLLHLCGRDDESIARLRREYEARRKAGFDHSWLTASQAEDATGVAAGGAIRTRGFALDPYRACLGLAAAAAARGAAVFERSPVKRIRTSRRGVEVVADGGTVRADAVVIATGAPLADLRSLRRHLRPEHGYAVVTAPLGAAARSQVGMRTSAQRDEAAPPHFLRWLRDDRVLFWGADQAPVASRSQSSALEQRTGQLMYELSLIYPAISGTRADWSWHFDHEGSVDGLPYIGPHRNFPHHLFALAHGRHGAAVSWLAARLLLRRFKDEAAKGDELFGFARVL